MIVDMPTICVRTLAVIVGMPALCARMMAALVETSAIGAMIALILAVRLVVTDTTVRRCMVSLVVFSFVFPVVMPLILYVSFVAIIVACAGRVTVIACHLQQACCISRFTVLSISVNARLRIGLYTAAGHKAGKAENRSGNCCGECSHDFVLCVFTVITNEVAGKRLTSVLR